MINKIDKEKIIVEQMIRLYCKKKEKNGALCNECQELIAYAHYRLDHCRWKENKKACKHCSTHCYKPFMKEKIKKVMHFSGPRMIIYHPFVVLKHYL